MVSLVDRLIGCLISEACRHGAGEPRTRRVRRIMRMGIAKVGSMLLAAGVVAVVWDMREREVDESIPLEPYVQPVLFDPPEVDLGSFAMNESRIAPLKLVNNGEDVMKVITARTSCSCSVLPDGIVGQTIEPGGFLEVPIEVGGGDHPQQLVSDTILRVESTTRPEHLYVVRGTVLANLIVPSKE